MDSVFPGRGTEIRGEKREGSEALPRFQRHYREHSAGNGVPDLRRVPAESAGVSGRRLRGNSARWIHAGGIRPPGIFRDGVAELYQSGADVPCHGSGGKEGRCPGADQRGVPVPRAGGAVPHRRGQRENAALHWRLRPDEKAGADGSFHALAGGHDDPRVRVAVQAPIPLHEGGGDLRADSGVRHLLGGRGHAGRPVQRPRLPVGAAGDHRHGAHEQPWGRRTALH